MAGNDDETEEPSDEVEGNGPEAALEPKGRRLSFGKVRRELTEEELGSSGVQKMLLDELDRMDGAESELKDVSKKFNDCNTDLAVSIEKLRTHHAFDVLSTGTIAGGSLTFGGAFSITNNDKLFYSLLAISVALIIIGIFAKVMRA